MSKEKNIYITFDPNDGEVFTAYEDYDKCCKDAEESGCGVKELTLILKDD